MAVHHESLESKIAKLPGWAREHIKRLEQQVSLAVEQAAREREKTGYETDRADKYHDANNALMEILRCAGRGGSALGAVIVSILECYEIFREPHKVDHAGQTQTEP